MDDLEVVHATGESKDLKLDSKIDDYIHRDLAMLDEDASVVEGARVMRRQSVGSVVVTRDDKPVGIVTERDVLYKIVAEGMEPAKTVLRQAMSSPLVSVPVGTTVRKALAIMVKHNFRRLLVCDGDKIVGMIAQWFLIGDMQDYSVPLPELEIPKGIRCPYCNAMFPDKKSLSKHIDNMIRGEILSEDGYKWRRGP